MKSPIAMSSGSVPDEYEIKYDKTWRATYERLSVLGDALHVLVELTMAADETSQWMQTMRSNLSRHNHRDLISDDDWRPFGQRDSQFWTEELMGSLPVGHPLMPTLRLILSDMQESFDYPLLSR